MGTRGQRQESVADAEGALLEALGLEAGAPGRGDLAHPGYWLAGLDPVPAPGSLGHRARDDLETGAAGFTCENDDPLVVIRLTRIHSAHDFIQNLKEKLLSFVRYI